MTDTASDEACGTCSKGSKGHFIEITGEQREKRLDFVPDVSALDHAVLKIDVHTKAMLKSMDMGGISNLKVERHKRR